MSHAERILALIKNPVPEEPGYNQYWAKRLKEYPDNGGLNVNKKFLKGAIKEIKEKYYPTQQVPVEAVQYMAIMSRCLELLEDGK